MLLRSARSMARACALVLSVAAGACLTDDDPGPTGGEAADEAGDEAGGNDAGEQVDRADGGDELLEEPVCGDGALDEDEECDDANTMTGDGCSAQCLIEGCGNLRIDPGETCDDGNHEVGDGCSADCRSLEICGDGILNDYVHILPGGAAAAPEGCDDGNVDDGDGCSADCGSLETCGDAVKNDDEICDDGSTCQNGMACTQDADCFGIGDGSCAPRNGEGCSADCLSLGQCGNGIIDSGETCDDANVESGDGCSYPECTVEP